MTKKQPPSPKQKLTQFNQPCAYPHCKNLTKQTYCDTHADHRRSYDLSRASSSKRGYDARWRRYRVSFIQKNPYCKQCMDEHGRVSLATVVDHITPHKGSYAVFWDFENHQALCKECHDRKTAGEDMGGWDSSKGLR